jgi:hypothetical protein
MELLSTENRKSDVFSTKLFDECIKWFVIFDKQVILLHVLEQFYEDTKRHSHYEGFYFVMFQPFVKQA